MPRQARLDAPGTLHHVMIRGIEGKSIFRDNRDRKEFVTRLGNLIKETGTRVLAWSLLRNHVHLLLFSGPSGLTLFMRRLLTGYAQGFNRRHKRRGHLFQKRAWASKFKQLFPRVLIICPVLLPIIPLSTKTPRLSLS